MKARTWLACLACIVVGIALSDFLQSQSNGQDKVVNPKLTKWEYKVLVHPDARRLNDQGQEGWELVTVTTPTLAGDGVTSYFKRPAP
jgi:hypothetical protein